MIKYDWLIHWLKTVQQQNLIIALAKYVIRNLKNEIRANHMISLITSSTMDPRLCSNKCGPYHFWNTGPSLITDFIEHNIQVRYHFGNLSLIKNNRPKRIDISKLIEIKVKKYFLGRIIKVKGELRDKNILWKLTTMKFF